jgi:hypothetical protein
VQQDASIHYNESKPGCTNNGHAVAASLSALVATGKCHCIVFCELLYSVMKEVANENNDG